jgi:hypothetical protein
LYSSSSVTTTVVSLFRRTRLGGSGSTANTRQYNIIKKTLPPFHFFIIPKFEKFFIS